MIRLNDLKSPSGCGASWFWATKKPVCSEEDSWWSAWRFLETWVCGSVARALGMVTRNEGVMATTVPQCCEVLAWNVMRAPGRQEETEAHNNQRMNGQEREQSCLATGHAQVETRVWIITAEGTGPVYQRGAGVERGQGESWRKRARL